MNELTIFGLERLEDRVLLAVNIKQSGTTLTITGSGEDETIHIHDDGGGIRVHVDEDGGGEDFDVYYSGVVNIKIDLKGGYDYVGISDLSIAGTLDIKTGAQEDQVRVGSYADPFNSYFGEVEIGKDLKIDTGSHNDFVKVYADDYDTSIGGKLEIKTQGGDDDVHVYAEDYSDLDVGKDVKIDTGGGYDDVRVDAHPYGEIDIDGKLEIKTGANDDYVYVGGEGFLSIGKDLHIDTGGGSSSGEDAVIVAATAGGESYGEIDVGGNVHINTHNSDDFVLVAAAEGGDIYIGKDLDIHTGGDSGEDFVIVFAGEFGGYAESRIEVGRHLNVHTHNGDDFVAIAAAEGGEIAVFDSTHIDLGNAGGEGDFFAAVGLEDIFGLGDGSIDFYDKFHLHQHNGPSQVYVDDIVTFHDDASFDGGNGYDEIFFIATYFGDLDIKNFESVGP